MKVTSKTPLKLPAIQLYSIYSKSLDFYNVPFYASTDKEAQNVVRISVLGGKDSVYRDKLDDLYLVAVGSFDSDSGTLVPEHRAIACLSDIPLLNHIERDGGVMK